MKSIEEMLSRVNCWEMLVCYHEYNFMYSCLKALHFNTNKIKIITMSDVAQLEIFSVLTKKL